MLHFLHWCYTWTALLSANQNRVIFSCVLLITIFQISLFKYFYAFIVFLLSIRRALENTALLIEGRMFCIILIEFMLRLNSHYGSYIHWDHCMMISILLFLSFFVLLLYHVISFSIICCHQQYYHSHYAHHCSSVFSS